MGIVTITQYRSPIREHVGERVIINADPLEIWVDTHTKLEVYPGASIQEVEDLAREAGVSWVTRRIVAYWFALGERVKSGRLGKPWKRSEIRSNRDRRYL